MASKITKAGNMKTIKLEDQMNARERIHLISNAAAGLAVYFSLIAFILV